MKTPKITARQIISDTTFDLAGWYADMLTGANYGRCVRIYLDLHEMDLSSNVLADPSDWLEREDGSLQEVAEDRGWGTNLSQDEIAAIREHGVSDSGFGEWLDYQLEPKIQEQLDKWYAKIDSAA